MRLLALVFLVFVVACTTTKKPKLEVLDGLEAQAVTDLQQGNLAAADEKLNKVLADSPQRWRSLNALGILHSFKNEIPQAQASFASADSISPNNPAVLNNWGLALAIDNRYDEAIAKLMQAVEVAPPTTRTQPELNLALIYALSGNEKPAEIILHRYMTPAKIRENMKFYRGLRKDQQKSRQVLQNAYGVPQMQVPVEDPPVPLLPAPAQN
jgi:Tfp pilus assembly protein PilF